MRTPACLARLRDEIMAEGEWVKKERVNMPDFPVRRGAVGATVSHRTAEKVLTASD